eukprot:189678_1
MWTIYSVLNTSTQFWLFFPRIITMAHIQLIDVLDDIKLINDTIGPHDILLKEKSGSVPENTQPVPSSDYFPSRLIYRQLPQWNYSSPNGILIQNGLTESVLQEELRLINQKSRQTYNSNFVKPSACKNKIFRVGIVLMFIGVILFITDCSTSGSFDVLTAIGMTMFCIGLIVSICFYESKARMDRDNSKHIMNEMKKYIEIDLNEKYKQQSVFQWKLVHENVTVITERLANTLDYQRFHIMIKVVNIDDTIIAQIFPVEKQQIPTQNGNIISHNEVQIVMVNTKQSSQIQSVAMAVEGAAASYQEELLRKHRQLIYTKK